MPCAPAANFNDFAGHDYRNDSHGAQVGNRRRAVHAHGARHHWRPHLVGAADDFYRARSIFVGVRQAPEGRAEPNCGDRGMKEKVLMTRAITAAKPFLLGAVLLCLWTLLPQPGWAQSADETSAENLPSDRKSTRL